MSNYKRNQSLIKPYLETLGVKYTTHLAYIPDRPKAADDLGHAAMRPGAEGLRPEHDSGLR